MSRIKYFTKPIIIFCAVSVILSTLFLSRNHFGSHIDRSDDSAVETFDFHDTEDEQKCFANDIVSTNPIPNIVHFIWLNNPDLNFITYLSIRATLISLQPDQIVLHYTSLNKENQWFAKVSNHLTLVQHDLKKEYPVQVEQKWKISHISDLLRLDILYNEGGIYLDTDVIPLRDFDRLLHLEKDLILGNEGGDRHGICNAVIIARQGSSFIERWRESYVSFSRSEWNYHSVILPKELSVLFPDEVCDLSPAAFFWPTWTKKHIKYMHEPIKGDEVGNFKRTLNANRGAMYPQQLAYHGWTQLASGYLKNLDPATVKSRDTRFNIMARRFLE
ncbi:hypothetical protein N7478_002788 [Penicillium angulare]|uniref:uncharacterized protein n=1 Tax=Penicillium angulare TaxID=116970 RepID=UPI0025416F9D|nr:uncharacterized protein N7478_002788 [Penicillium angulare]KAJ5287102.1 hypothetical protein N7478_002788 [Penicillium angulare]